MSIWKWFVGPDIEVIYTNSDYTFIDGFWQTLLAPFILALVVIGGIFIAFGVAAAVFFAITMAVLGILFAGVSMFWPILLAALIFYWLFSDPKQKPI